MCLWTTHRRESELHGEDLRIRRAAVRDASSSSTPGPPRTGHRPQPLCTAVPGPDLRRCALSTDRTVPTTTTHLYTGRSTVELHPTPTLWNTPRHGRIQS